MKTFRIGGIHPPSNKLSVNKKVEILALPEKVYIPVSQHIGAPAIPVVQRGDQVKVGTLIAKSAGFISANIHSSVSGKVLKIEPIMTTSGYKQDAVWIETEGDEWEDTIDRSEDLIAECDLSGKEIIEKVEKAGIVGLGGATFPTNVKLSSSVGKAEYLLVNAAECEPYLTDDHALLLLKPEEIIAGTRILMKAIEVKKAFIGIEINKPDAIKLLTSCAEKYPEIEIVPLKMKYPQGGEKQLIDAILKRQVPGGKLPADVGCAVQNVGSVFAVYEAVQKNKPLVERLVTVTGKYLKNPMDVKVRIGTPLLNLIDHAGGLPKNTGKIIAGGPLMGKAVVDTNIPVTKGVSGVLMMSEKESVRKKSRACIRCGECVSVCSMSLVPSYLMTVSKLEEWERAEHFNITDCIECGSCMYVCPSNRPLLDYIRVGKGKVLTQMRNRK